MGSARRPSGAWGGPLLLPVARSAEETGLQVAAERIAFVLEATSWDGEQNLIEIVFMGSERDRNAGPLQVEERLAPQLSFPWPISTRSECAPR